VVADCNPSKHSWLLRGLVSRGHHRHQFGLDDPPSALRFKQAPIQSCEALFSSQLSGSLLLRYSSWRGPQFLLRSPHRTTDVRLTSASKLDPSKPGNESQETSHRALFIVFNPRRIYAVEVMHGETQTLLCQPRIKNKATAWVRTQEYL